MRRCSLCLQVVIPFLVVHGSEDTVTDPDISKELYEKAQSPDKTLKIYEGFWHSLTAGELDANMDSVFAVSCAVLASLSP